MVGEVQTEHPGQPMDLPALAGAVEVELVPLEMGQYLHSKLNLSEIPEVRPAV